MDEPEEKEEEPEEIEKEPEAEDDSEETTDEEEKPEEESEYITIRHNGKDVSLTYDELIANAQKGFNYEYMKSEVTEERRTVAAERQQVQQESEMQRAFMTEYAELMSMDSQLQQYQSVNWNAYVDQDPIEANKAYMRYQELVNTRNLKANDVNSKQTNAQRVKQQNLAQVIESGARELKQSIRDWSPEKAKELKIMGVESYQFTPEEMAQVYDPRMVKVLNDAYQWRQLQSKKPQIVKKVADVPKVVKPGNNSKPDAKAERAKQFQQMRKLKSKKARESVADSLLDAYV